MPTGPSAGQGSSAANQHVTYTYNALGQASIMYDRNSTQHYYAYDALGRQIQDMDLPNNGIGDMTAAMRLTTLYDTQGNAYLLTRYVSLSGAVANQVKRVFNDLGQLIQEFQEHNGAIPSNNSSRSVQYIYADMAGGLKRQQRQLEA